jgi:hypothetical protein
MYDKAEEIIREGARATEVAIPKIEEAIKAWRETNNNG